MSPAEWVGLVAALFGLLAGIAAAWLKLGAVVWDGIKLALAFFREWNGEPARPGHEAVPSVPEQLATLDQRTRRIELATTSNDDKLSRLDARVTDHRRRNELQISALRTEIERRLTLISGDLLHATMRAVLHELAVDVDVPPSQRRAPLDDADAEHDDQEPP